jgi:hypothetical protein
MRFTLEIEMGNEAMLTYADIAFAVRRIFPDFANRSEEVDEDENGNLYDANGNKVGTWAVTE